MVYYIHSFSATCLKFLKNRLYFLEQKDLHIYRKTEKLVQRLPINLTPSFPYYSYFALLWYIVKIMN